MKLIKFDGEIIDAPPALLALPASPDSLIVAYLLPSGIRIGFYDPSLGWVIRPRFLQPEPFNSDETKFWVTEGHPDNGFFRTEPKSGDLFGLIRNDGSWVLEPRFTYVEKLTYVEEEDISVATVGIDGPLDENHELTKLYGVIDEDGNVLVPIENERIVRIRSGTLETGYRGYLVGHKNETIGLYDFSGNLIGGRFFDDIRKTVTPNIFQITYDGITALMDGEGNIDFDSDINAAESEAKVLVFTCASGIKVWNFEDGYRVFDANGEQLTSHVFSYIYNPAYSYLEEDYLGQSETPLDCVKPFSVKLGDVEGELWETGKLFFQPSDVSFVSGFEAGKAAFNADGLWGIISDDSAIIIPAMYNEINGLHDLYRVTLGDREFWIDETNSEVAPPIEKIDITNREYAHYCYPLSRKGKRFTENGLWGIVDADGEVALAASFVAVSCFDNGIAWAPNEAMQMWCPIGPDGNWLSAPECRPVYAEDTQHTKTPPDEYSSSVAWMTALLGYGVGVRENPLWVAD